MQDNKRPTRRAKSRPGKVKTEQGDSVSQSGCENEQVAAYYNAMMRVEDSMWIRWGRLRADSGTREIQRAMFRALASLELMYQVRFVSLYIMFLMRSSWERVVSRLGRGFESRSSGLSTTPRCPRPESSESREWLRLLFGTLSVPVQYWTSDSRSSPWRLSAWQSPPTMGRSLKEVGPVWTGRSATPVTAGTKLPRRRLCWPSSVWTEEALPSCSS
ncbi:cyclin A-like protein [Cryptosporidium canis]|uniref:Cyclin A-like protein n=1 Tax=Cryptosporidium canis TaxID=195482 RepID=A0ABQ8P4Y6_9CRYT|nr:cyclin A-like protein [Cryptosporidium canis]